MPPLETNPTFSPQPNSNQIPNPISSRSYSFFTDPLLFIVLSIIIFIISKKFPRLKKLKWLALLFFIAAIISAFFSFASPGPPGSSPFGSGTNIKVKPLPAPTNVEEKIQGYWGTRLFLITSSFETDLEKMKETGINTITMAPQLEHKGDGDVTEQQGTEAELKRAINTAHQAGFRVMLDPAPMTTEFNPKTEDPDLFIKNMKKISIKYAKLAEEFNVEYYSPLTEPVAQLGAVKASEYMHDILPQIKKKYSGKVVFKKQSNDIEEFKLIEEDHTAKIEFMITGDHFGVGFGKYMGERLSLSMGVTRSSLDKQVSNNYQSLGKKELPTERNKWHSLKIEQKGKSISYTLDGKPLFSYSGNQNFSGGYSLSSGGVTIRKITIKDSKGKSLISEKKIGDNWSGIDGWSIEENELVGSMAANPAKNAGELNLIHDMDFSGYDILAIHLWKEGTVQSLADYRKEVRYKIKKTRQQADSDGVPEILVGEFGGTTLQEVEWGTNRIKTEAGRPMTGSELAAVAQMVMEEAEETTSGYLYNGWDIEGQGIDQIPEVGRVIKAWYTTH